MCTTNISVENHFLHCINSFASWVLSLLFSDEEPSADESKNEHFCFSTHFPSGQSRQSKHHPTAIAVRQPWITFACTVSVVMCKGFSAYFESFFPKASSGRTDRYAWYFQLCICWNLRRSLFPHPQPAPPAGFEVISWLCNTLFLHCTSWTFFFFKVNMKILASKKKLSINLKYMQVQGKGKGKTSCDQACT